MDERLIGENLREIRLSLGQTLTEVAKLAGLTKSTLSKIETGQVSAPISTFMKIADAMGRELAEFFRKPSERPPFVLTRKGEGETIVRGGSKFGYTYEALAIEMPGKRAEPFLLTIQPGDKKGTFGHGGQSIRNRSDKHFRYPFSVHDGSTRNEYGDAYARNHVCLFR